MKGYSVNNPRDIVLKSLAKEQIADDVKLEHWDWEDQSAYGFSLATIHDEDDKVIRTKSKIDCFNAGSSEITQDTLFNVASITKTFTAATILRMMEDKRFSQYFPDKLDTKLSEFYDFLKQRYPQSNYVSNRLHEENPKISLRHLLTHTSGFPYIDWKSNKLDKETLRKLRSEVGVADGRFLETNLEYGDFGVHVYSDMGYELLGMIISAVATKYSKNNGGEEVKCGEVMRELVIERLAMNDTFTPDQISFDAEAGKVVVSEDKDRKIARGYAYYDDNLVESRVFQRCISCSGIYSTPVDVCKFFQAFFSDKLYADGGLFDEAGTIALKNSGGVVIRRDEDTQETTNYEIGFLTLKDNLGNNKRFCHAGSTVGFSGWAVYQDGKTSCCIMNTQSLTPHFAKAILEDEIRHGKVVDNEQEKHLRLSQINNDLLAKYQKTDLIKALRLAEANSEGGNELEKNQALLSELQKLDRQKELCQSLISATQRNYEMGKVIYRQVGNETPEITLQGEVDFHNPGKAITAQTISGVGSISKQFTAATLMKLWDEEISRDKDLKRNEARTDDYITNFPNGIDTPFSHFLPKLRAKFPQCAGIFNQFQFKQVGNHYEEDENFAKITLRDLLNHTHGLGARDDKKLMQLMHNNPNRPLELSEIINSTLRPTKSQYGQHYYSNVGYDLAAMIIETITNQKFEDVVKNKVLRPNELHNTHPQDDHIALYAEPKNDMARGFVFNPYHPEVETNFNTRSNTRAAGGFKSTVQDLAKFASLYMGAEMFANEEVKCEILDIQKGAALQVLDENGKLKAGDGVRPSMKKDDKYHLAITSNKDGSIGHPGVDFDFLANLRFYPQGEGVREKPELRISLSVVENLSSDICKNTLTKTSPETLKIIKEFWENKLQPQITKVGDPEVGGELWQKIVEVELLKEENAEYLAALEKYSKLRTEVLNASRDELLRNYQSLISQTKPDTLDLATNKEPSMTLEKSHAEKMSQVKGSKFNEI